MYVLVRVYYIMLATYIYMWPHTHTYIHTCVATCIYIIYIYMHPSYVIHNTINIEHIIHIILRSECRGQYYL